jgi:heavy metal sensor kinase
MSARIPIRWRLTFWYAAFLAGALILFGAAIYVAVRVQVYNTFEDQLRNRAALAKAAVNTSSSDLSLNPSVITNLSGEEGFVRLIAPDGSLVVDTSQEVGVDLSEQSLLTDGRSGAERLTRVSGADERFWVIATPVQSGDATAGVLEIGMSSEDEVELLKILLIVLGIAAPAALAMAIVGGYALAGRALKPVDQITGLAAKIGADDLGSRLELDLPNDELGRLARTFDAMLARIEDAFERQRQFTGDAAHELRTPLTLLRSQVDIALAQSRTPDEYREALVGIDGDIDRLSGLVTILLTLARADSGQLAVEREKFDVQEAIQATLDQYVQRAGTAQVNLVNDSASANVVGDEDLIIQVLMNLLDNALAHTVAGDTITIGNRAESDVVRIWVEDTGSGIPQQHIDHVFDRFYRVDTGRTRRAGGIGLGLAISKAIIEAHNGTITLASTPEVGTRVEIILPSSK